MRRGLALGLALTATALVAAPPAWAGPPADQLFARIDQVLRTLDDPELKQPVRAPERRQTIRRIAGDIFDFEEIARRSLGRHWQARTPAERQEFVRVFGDLLERAYIGKIELYSGEKVAFLGDAIDGELATVLTCIVTRQGTEIPVDYRMLRRGDRWRAYDVIIEGVSLVANYRTQFDKVIQRTSYQQLVQQVRARQ
ncbi:MAG: ABC transporter substrate-binding protein [Candidatus Rokubacteria bacterium]|nr:ABC transporter substrate-binding protein [Candidatus Rokubacteria bacterium]